MAALVQSFPQTSTVTMLQTRPSSSNSQQSLHYSTNPSQMSRNNYHGIPPNAGPSTYRGQTSMAQSAAYAFANQSTLSANTPRGQPVAFLNKDQRTSSAPVTPTVNSVERSRYPAPASVSTISSSSSSDISAAIRSAGTRDDSSISSTPSSGMGVTKSERPQSQIITAAMQLLPPSQQVTAKPSPERYRRPGNRRNESSTGAAASPSASIPPSPSGGTAATGSFLPQLSNSSFQMPNFNADFQVPAPQFYAQSTAARSSAEDIRTTRQQPVREDSASRYRRRSVHTSDLGGFSNEGTGAPLYQGSQQGLTGARMDQQAQHPLRSYPVGPSRPSSSPGRNASSESVGGNARSSHQRQTSTASSASVANAPPTTKPATAEQQLTLKHEQSPAQSSQSQPQSHTQAQSSRSADTSIRKVSNPDAAKRVAAPSPLSKPMTMGPDSPATKDSFASAVSAAIKTPAPPPTTTGTRPDSPAAKQLAALGVKDDKKSKAFRLRRAFSFGSAAELRKASGGTPLPAVSNANEANLSTADRARLRKERYQDEREAEQAKVAARQEAGGIGAGIYSGQGNFFSGSTDNLSISSTASSASVMLRKMGKGMKKSTRSLVGLFRPKSVIGVPAADGPLPEFSQAQVSMVTVEAERERVNVNASPHGQVGGGTGFPKLERNSIDAGAATANGTDSSLNTQSPRRSIVGGEAERQEVLAAVKKGILKRAQTDSPSSSPNLRAVDGKGPNFNLPTIPTSNDSPNSTAPSTPNDDQGHKRNGSIALNGEDYFMSALRFRGESKSSPPTPLGTLKRNATFSPRIQFHDTWPSGEYDRRGEIATCNRLTPMLAQQIKEELNNFKMEMEVHENSKIYTHFF